MPIRVNPARYFQLVFGCWHGHSMLVQAGGGVGASCASDRRRCALPMHSQMRLPTESAARISSPSRLSGVLQRSTPFQSVGCRYYGFIPMSFHPPSGERFALLDVPTKSIFFDGTIFRTPITVSGWPKPSLVHATA
jgi:hypothetical protein